jgi:subtilisin family serine protease
VAAAAERYRRDPAVTFAEPNAIVRKAAVTPDDPLFAQQWALAEIGMPDAWGISTASPVTVAIVDTGIRLDHPDLEPNLWTSLEPDGDGIAGDVHGASFLTHAGSTVVTGNPMDDDVAESHGTHVAGIVGAAGGNGLGVAGVAWSVKLLGVKVLAFDGSGTISDVVAGIEYALDHGATVLNLSLEAQDLYSDALEAAIADADARGALVVSAAGNDPIAGRVVIDRELPQSLGVLASPASIRTPNAIAVAATVPGDVPAYYSNHGALTIDVAAPGGSDMTGPGAILSTVARCADASPADGLCDLDPAAAPSAGYGPLAGTSMAAPHVSGLAALVWAAHPALTHHQVKARILNSAATLPALAGFTITGGRIDAAAALSMPEELPAVFKVVPYAPDPESTVTVVGANFGASPGSVTVGATPLSVVSWSDGQIVATLPPGTAAGPVQVNGTGMTFPLFVGGFPPEVTSLHAAPASGKAPLAVAFGAFASDPEGGALRWEWDFGKGKFQSYAGIEGSAQVTFNVAGTYTVRVRVTDPQGLAATASVPVTVSGEPPSSDRRCFIATAAWGSPLEPHVASLRAFRDRWLLASAPGRAAVDVYYRLSPPLARTISRHPPLRAAARWALTPVVACVEEPLLLPSLALLAGALAAARLARRTRRPASRSQ